MEKVYVVYGYDYQAKKEKGRLVIEINNPL